MAGACPLGIFFIMMKMMANVISMMKTAMNYQKNLGTQGIMTCTKEYMRVKRMNLIISQMGDIKIINNLTKSSSVSSAISM